MEAGHSTAWTLAIFVAETCVVTLSTIRTILVARHQRVVAPLLGLVEISLWLVAITQVMRNLTSPSYFVAFVAGFGVGNYLGVCVEDWMALGYAVVQIVTRKDPSILVQAFREARFGITRLDGQGVMGPVHLLFSVVPRSKLATVSQLIEATDPEAFYIVDELRHIRRGFVPPGMLFPLWPSRRPWWNTGEPPAERSATESAKILQKTS
ncbi:MAG: DUF5698 domain-containing protein [Gemmatales bacterium]|nr:DUF5698 domain-containing protein [Gemmatales bacterium]MDW8175465.1 DUF5698 domain-containing protein [Gemmatales bacterium]